MSRCEYFLFILESLIYVVANFFIMGEWKLGGSIAEACPSCEMWNMVLLGIRAEMRLVLCTKGGPKSIFENSNVVVPMQIMTSPSLGIAFRSVPVTERNDALGPSSAKVALCEWRLDEEIGRPREREPEWKRRTKLGRKESKSKAVLTFIWTWAPKQWGFWSGSCVGLKLVSSVKTYWFAGALQNNNIKKLLTGKCLGLQTAFLDSSDLSHYCARGPGSVPCR